ncbi:MAG: Alkylhydroperoxidase AhpD core [Variovorax sp.]|nr:Alkylhydroperoxidase AhpD core [Variovorax sp.]
MSKLSAFTSTRRLLLPAVLLVSVAATTTTANAQQPPAFLRDTYPPQALSSTLQDMDALTGSKAVLNGKVRQLIGLAVAATVPCQYCIYLHTKGAKAMGATDAEIREAVAAAAETRKMSTVLYGNAYDLTAFRAEVDAMFAAKK